MSRRASALRRLADQVFDVLVVGAGATGAAVARDAALRGLRVALCDRGDFGGETSAHSSKLIHGGLRYLEHGHLPLVFEALAERRRLMRTAPHLCRPAEFLFPAYRGEDPSLAKLAIGVALYDALALWRPPVRSRRLDPAELLALAPGLRAEGLRGALSYVDCQTDDTRLVLENVLDAETAGTVALSYLEVVRSGQRRRGHLHLLEVGDREPGPGAGDRFTVRARTVVNATGPFSDAFRTGRPALRPTLGVHLVVPGERLPTGGRAFVVRSPRDRRIMFVLPDGVRTVVGTTDTDWNPEGSAGRPVAPGDEVRARADDVDYLLDSANHAFPSARLSVEDVVSTYAGLRPLLASDDANPSASSREHAIWVDGSGILTVAGGKLTTMRSMAEETVDRLVELLQARGFDEPVGPCLTRRRPLPGAQGLDPDPESGGLSATLSALHELSGDVHRHLLVAYGARAREVLTLAASLGQDDSPLHQRLVPELPFLAVEALHAVRHEHAREVEDVLRRRLPIFRMDRRQGLGCARLVADLLTTELGWSPARRARSLADYEAAVLANQRWRGDPRTRV